MDSIKIISYFKGFEDGSEYLYVEVDGKLKVFEAQGEVEKKDGTRRDSGC